MQSKQRFAIVLGGATPGSVIGSQASRWDTLSFTSLYVASSCCVGTVLLNTKMRDEVGVLYGCIRQITCGRCGESIRAKISGGSCRAQSTHRRELLFIVHTPSHHYWLLTCQYNRTLGTIHQTTHLSHQLAHNPRLAFALCRQSQCFRLLWASSCCQLI